MSYDIIFKNANITNDTSSFTSDIGIKSGKISEIGDLGNSSDNIIELDHLNLIPGVIDTQVHFR